MVLLSMKIVVFSLKCSGMAFSSHLCHAGEHLNTMSGFSNMPLFLCISLLDLSKEVSCLVINVVRAIRIQS